MAAVSGNCCHAKLRTYPRHHHIANITGASPVLELALDHPGLGATVSSCQFLSRWSESVFQMYYYTFPVPVRTGTYQYVPLQYVLNTLFLYNQSESRFQVTRTITGIIMKVTVLVTVVRPPRSR
jgi:hypothetical protein